MCEVNAIITTRLTGGLSQGYKPTSPASEKDAGFYFVQASSLLTRHKPLKEVFALLTTIPKGAPIFFYTQFIQRYIMLFLFLDIFLNGGFICT